MREQNEWVKRYLYDVVRRLPENQRKDIEEELETLIEDMLEERSDNGKSEMENVEAVLRELGEPSKLAEKYRGEKQYLIGGEYYSLYCQVLKIVLICVGAGMVIACVIGSFVQGVTNATDMDNAIIIMRNGMLDIVAIPSALFQAFGMITFVFLLLERNQVKLKTNVSWTLDMLPEIPVKKAMLSRADSIVGMIFTVLVSIMFIYVPQLMGAWVTNEAGNVVAIPVFNMAIWNQVLPIFLLSMVAGLADKLTKLIIGRYTLTVMWVNIVTNSIIMALSVYIFRNPDIWNQGFWDKVAEITGENIPDFSQIGGIAWMNLHNGFEVIALIIVFGCVLEMVETVYHTVRYGMKK